ncbi:MAG: AhpC/TSA family protein [Cytophagaceae bacterium]|jgi:peroxiredoxin|nr:AhpC/TSA family protein [Cytophagaceae bacterium]
MKKLILLFSLLSLFANAQMTTNQMTSLLLKTGDSIPDVTLQTMAGKPFALKTDLKNQPAIFIFYRANWCPYCNEHLSDLQDYEKQFIQLGYKIIAISTEATDQLPVTKSKTFVKYTLLSDEKREAIKAFGVENGPIAVPSVFIMDKNGIIRFVHSNPDYKTRLSGAEVLEYAKQAAN